MSMVYAAKYDDRVELLTDGGVYDHEGVILKTSEKVWRSDALPLAFAGRGDHEVIKRMVSFLRILTIGKTFDDFAVTFAEMLAAKKRQFPDQVKIDGVIAGISESLGPVIYYFHTDTTAGEEDPAPFTLLDAGVEAGDISHVRPRDFFDAKLPMFWAIDGLSAYGVAFFEVLRSRKMSHSAHPDKPKLFGIGGHVDHTVVTMNGATTKRLHTWPDKVGEKIRPLAA
ncbi:hypothetical protein EDF68_103317 [Ochrobactrum sp. BH3]|nr:hypothetical protein EDF68_103317 [Ochrobactrum sp. BH3]